MHKASGMWKNTEHSGSPSLQNTHTWETPTPTPYPCPEYTQPWGKESGGVAPGHKYRDGHISMPGCTLSSPGPKNREGEFETFQHLPGENSSFGSFVHLMHQHSLSVSYRPSPEIILGIKWQSKPARYFLPELAVSPRIPMDDKRPPPPSPLGQAPGSSQRRGQGSGFEDIFLVALTDFSGSPEAPAAYPADPAAFHGVGREWGTKPAAGSSRCPAEMQSFHQSSAPSQAAQAWQGRRARRLQGKPSSTFRLVAGMLLSPEKPQPGLDSPAKKRLCGNLQPLLPSGFLLQRPAGSFVCRLQAFSGQKSTVSSSVIRGFAKAGELSPRMIISSESPRPRGCLVFTFIH